jgi:hypothetical protein
MSICSFSLIHELELFLIFMFCGANKAMSAKAATIRTLRAVGSGLDVHCKAATCMNKQ